MNKVLCSLAFIAITPFVFTACKKHGEEIIVYPNPATSYVIFDATNNANKHKNGEIVVKNTAGDVISSFKIADSSRIQWQIDSFPSGVYLYAFTADKMKKQTGRIQFN